MSQLRVGLIQNDMFNSAYKQTVREQQEGGKWVFLHSSDIFGHQEILLSNLPD